MYKRIITTLAVLGLGGMLLPAAHGEAVPALATARVEQSLDSNWRFALGDNAAAQAAQFDDSGWRALDVPHDWSIEGE